MVREFQIVSSFPCPLRNIKVENFNTYSSKDIEIQGGGGAVYPVVHLAFALINLISCSSPSPAYLGVRPAAFAARLSWLCQSSTCSCSYSSIHIPLSIPSLCSSSLLRLWSLKEALAANYPEGVSSCIALCWNTDVRDLCCCIDRTVRTWCLVDSSFAFALIRRQHYRNLYRCFDLLEAVLYQLNATEVFNADLIARSTCFGHHYAHHQELKSIIQWLLPLVFRAVVFQVAGLVWSWGLCVRFAGCAQLMGIVVPETSWASNKICNKNLCCI